MCQNYAGYILCADKISEARSQLIKFQLCCKHISYVYICYVEVTSSTATSDVVSVDYEVPQSIALSTGLTYFIH